MLMKFIRISFSTFFGYGFEGCAIFGYKNFIFCTLRSIMPTFIIQEAGQPDRAFTTTKKTFFIGRGQSCDLLLPHITISKEHAKIYKLQESYFIEDVSGQNNMLINQKPRTKYELALRDAIQLSKFTIIFFPDKLSPMDQFFEGKALDEFPPYARTTGGNRTDATFQMSPEMVKKMLQNSNKVRNARIISGTDTWTPGDKIVGFGKNAQIPITGWFTGGVAAEIHWTGADHVLKKTGALVSVKVHGAKLKADHILCKGDQFSVGNSTFTYTIEEG